jgi:hypothetical protein
MYNVVITGSWVNKGATDELWTRYLYSRSDQIRQVHKYISRGYVDQGVLSTQNRLDSSRVDWT